MHPRVTWTSGWCAHPFVACHPAFRPGSGGRRCSHHATGKKHQHRTVSPTSYYSTSTTAPLHLPASLLPPAPAASRPRLTAAGGTGTAAAARRTTGAAAATACCAPPARLGPTGAAAPTHRPPPGRTPRTSVRLRQLRAAHGRDAALTCLPPPPRGTTSLHSHAASSVSAPHVD